MTFLHTTLLGGVLLIGIPILLHLAIRQKPRTLEFPALRFLQLRRHANERRLRLHHWLLLLLRCLVVALLALALARPTLMVGGLGEGTGGPVAAALVIDVAPHMQYRQQEQTCLASAQEMARRILKQIPAESDLAVVEGSGGVAAFSVDPAAAAQRIQRLEMRPISRSLPSLILDALRLLETSERSQREIYVLTDLSRAAWPTESAATLQSALEKVPGLTIQVIDVGIAEPVNQGLGPLRVESSARATGGALRVRSELFSQHMAGERGVELWIEDAPGKPTLRGQQSIRLTAGEQQAVDFRIQQVGMGIRQGYVKLAGEDALAGDDRRFFTVQGTPPLKILLAAPEPADEYSLFLEQAIAPYPLRIKGEAPYDCQSVPLDQLAKLPLNEFAAVALLDPTPLPISVWQKLADYVSQGHGLAIFLGRNAKPIDSFNQAAAQELLPAPLVRHFLTDDEGVFLAPASLDHPLLLRFAQLGREVPWSESPVFRFWQLKPISESSPARVVLPFSNGEPALLERTLRRGRILTMTTPVSDPLSERMTSGPNRSGPWNFLPADWPFPMLMQQCFAYLVGGDASELNYQAGQTAVLRMPTQLPQLLALVASPAGQTYRQSINDRDHTLLVPATDAVGNYQIQIGGERDGVRGGFSVNFAPEATDLNRLDEGELKQLFGSVTPKFVSGTQDIEREEAPSSGGGRELFPLLMLVLVAILTAEQIVSNRFYRDADQGPGEGARGWAKKWRPPSPPELPTGASQP